MKTNKVTQLKDITVILNMLNEAFPPTPVGSIKRMDDGTMQRVEIQQDKYFTAYLNTLGMWWIVCSDYAVWCDAYENMQDCAIYMQEKHGVKCSPCNQHPVSIKIIRDNARAKTMAIDLFVGTVSWA